MNLAYFISSNEILKDDNWEKVITDNNNFQAISYWSDHVPDLYLLLLSSNHTINLWPVLDHKYQKKVLYSKHQVVINQIERLIKLAANDDRFSKSLQKLLAIKIILMANKREYFILNDSDVLHSETKTNFESKQFFHNKITSQRIFILNNELNEAEKEGDVTEKQSSLLRFFNNPETEIGFLDNEIVNDTYMSSFIPAETPKFLSQYNDVEYNADFEWYKVFARTDDQADYTTGIVTQSEHWIVPLGKYVYINTDQYDKNYSKSWIVAHSDYNIHNNDGSPWRNSCYLLDANGKLVRQNEYEKLYVFGQWAIARSVQEYQNGEGAKFINLETNEILPYEIEDAQLCDDLIIADLAITKQEREKLDNDYTWQRNKTGALDLNGNLVIPFEYENIGIFNKKYKLAIVRKNEKYGLIDIKGKIILATNYHEICDSYDKGPLFYKNSIVIKQKSNVHDDFYITCFVGISNTKGAIIVEPKYFNNGRLYDQFNRLGNLLAIDENDNIVKISFDGTIIDFGYKSADWSKARQKIDQEEKQYKINLRKIKNPETIPLSVLSMKFNELINLVTRKTFKNEDLEQCVEEFNIIDKNPKKYIKEYIDEDEQEETSAGNKRELNYHLIYNFLDEKDMIGNADWKFDPEDLAMFITTLSCKEFTFSYPEGSVSQELFLHANEALAAQNLELINLNSNGDNYGFVLVNKDDVARIIVLSQELDIPFERLN